MLSNLVFAVYRIMKWRTRRTCLNAREIVFFFQCKQFFLYELFKFIDPVSSLDSCNITDRSVWVQFLIIQSRLHQVTQNGRVRVSESRFPNIDPAAKFLLIDSPHWQAPLKQSPCECCSSVWRIKLKECVFLCRPWGRLGSRSHSAVHSEPWQ